MSVHSPPSPSRLPDPPIPFGNTIIDNVTPVLRIVKDSVTGMSVPGLEAAVGGAVAILETIQTMQNNKEDLRKLREDLDELKRNIKNASVDKSTNEQVRRLLQTVKVLKSIIATCDKIGESRRLRRFIQAKRIATQIAEVKQSVRDTLQVFQVFSIISIENDVGTIKETVAVIDENIVATRTNVMKIDTKVEDSKRFIILNKLEYAHARFDANGTPSGCMDGTRVDLLEELIGHVKGATDTSASSRFTLVCGIPGSGKSTIAKTVATRLADQHLLAASFFFSRNHAARREITLVFTTIAFQIAQYNNEYGDALSKILEQDTNLANATPSDQLEKLILLPLSQLASIPQEPWIILLDAVDECGSDRGDLLLKLLPSPTMNFPDHIRFFLTGRPEDPILSAFKQPSIQPITHMHTLSTTLKAPVSEDIRHYFRQSFSDDWPGRHGWKVNDDDLDVLVTRAGGLFIFASTVVKYIRDRALRHNPQTSMKFILGGVNRSEPRLLDQLYFKIIDDAAPVEDEEFVAQYRRVLGAVTNLLEPLSASAIADLLGMERSDVSRVVSLLSSVLLVSEETVRIAHLSFSEYITGTIRNDRADLLISGPYHHNDLANSSIRHMNEKLRRNICCFSALDTYKFNVDLPVPPVPVPISLRYACVYWASHLLEADIINMKELENGLEKWLDTNVLFWLEMLSICEELPRAIRLLVAAQAWYKKNVISTSSTHYPVLLSDTSRFIAAFYHTISSAAGHIHYSAFPFAPSSTELSKTYNRLPSDFVHVIKGVDSAWSPLHWSVHTGIVLNLAFSPNGEHIAATSGDDVEIRSSESGRLLLILKGHTGFVRAVAFSPDGACIASGSDDLTVRIWSSDKGQLLSALKGHTRDVNTVAFSPDGTSIASGSDDRTIRIWSSDHGRLLSTLKGHSDRVWTVAFSPDGTCVASGSDDYTVRIWSSDKGELLSTLKGHTGVVRAVAFSPDGARIASGSGDYTIRIWSPVKGEFLSALEGHTGMVHAVVFSPDGACIASGAGDFTIRIWSSDKGELLSTLVGHAGSVNTIAFSPDGTRIASGSSDTIRIWSLDKGQLLSTPEGHTKIVHTIEFSPDGVHIVSASYDDTIRVWSTRTGELIRTLDRKTTSVEDVVRSLDVGQRHHTFPPSDASPAMHNPPETEPPKLRPWSVIQVDENRGQLTLPSGRLLCMVPPVHLPIRCSAQCGLHLVLGLHTGGVIILDFSHVSDVK